MPWNETPTAERINALDREMAEHPGVVLHLSPPQCLALIGNLQLALRHPENNRGSADVAREVVERIAEGFGPEVRALVEEGWGEIGT